MPNEVGYLTLPVKDIARAQRFYGALFGWEFQTGPSGGAHVTNTTLPIGLAANGPVKAPFVYFRVEDFDAAEKRIVELGGAVSGITKSPAGIMAECTDDQETVFSIWQPAPGLGS